MLPSSCHQLIHRLRNTLILSKKNTIRTDSIATTISKRNVDSKLKLLITQYMVNKNQNLTPCIQITIYLLPSIDNSVSLKPNKQCVNQLSYFSLKVSEQYPHLFRDMLRNHTCKLPEKEHVEFNQHTVKISSNPFFGDSITIVIKFSFTIVSY